MKPALIPLVILGAFTSIIVVSRVFFAEIPYRAAARKAWETFQAVRGPVDYDNPAFLSLGLDAMIDVASLRRRLAEAGFATSNISSSRIHAHREYLSDTVRQKIPRIPTPIQPAGLAFSREDLIFYIFSDRPIVLRYSFRNSLRNVNVHRIVDLEAMTLYTEDEVVVPLLVRKGYLVSEGRASTVDERVTNPN